MLRVEYNPQDPNYLAVVVMDSPKTLILDVRYVPLGGAR